MPRKRCASALKSQAAKVHEYTTRTVVTAHCLGPVADGCHRLIVNRLTAALPDIPENWSTPLAPTKPPFLWNAPQGLWTQWRGVQQDPIFRNLTETMGVYMPIDLTGQIAGRGTIPFERAIARSPEGGESIGRLAPPQWPEEVFGKIDREKAKAGKALFMTHCAGCHNAWPYTWTEPNKYGKRFILVGLMPQTYVGTDPGQFRRSAAIRDHGPTERPSAAGELRGKKLLPTGDLYYGFPDRYWKPRWRS